MEERLLRAYATFIARFSGTPSIQVEEMAGRVLGMRWDGDMPPARHEEAKLCPFQVL